MNLIYATPEEIEDQIEFEVRNSLQLFNAKPLALITWHSQVLAYLRKWAWVKEFLEELHIPENIDASTKQTEFAALKRLDESIKGEFTTKHDECNAKIAEAYSAVGPRDYKMHLSEGEKWIAMLHGSMFQGEPDPFDFANELYVLQPLTLWIGELKRKRCAVLNDVRHTVRALFDEIPDAMDNFTEQLSAKALTTLRDRVALMEDNASPVHIAYEWTRDLENPRSVNLVDGVIVVRGPLLSFPLRQSDYWEEKAKLVRENGGFELRRTPIAATGAIIPNADCLKPGG